MPCKCQARSPNACWDVLWAKAGKALRWWAAVAAVAPPSSPPSPHLHVNDLPPHRPAQHVLHAVPVEVQRAQFLHGSRHGRQPRLPCHSRRSCRGLKGIGCAAAALEAISRAQATAWPGPRAWQQQMGNAEIAGSPHLRYESWGPSLAPWELARQGALFGGDLTISRLQNVKFTRQPIGSGATKARLCLPHLRCCELPSPAAALSQVLRRWITRRMSSRKCCRAAASCSSPLPSRWCSSCWVSTKGCPGRGGGGLASGTFLPPPIARTAASCLLCAALLKLWASGPKGNAVLLVGPCDAGKTTLFHQLRDGSTHAGTVASMQENVADGVLASEQVVGAVLPCPVCFGWSCRQGECEARAMRLVAAGWLGVWRAGAA